MNTSFKTILIAASLVGMSTVASANEKMAAYQTTNDTGYVVTRNDPAASNTTNLGYGKHYNSFSNDYRQPEMLSSNYVTEVQRELADEGFYNGRIDGIWGHRTTNAIRAYQRSRGWPVTGELSAASLNDMGIDYTDDGVTEAQTQVIEGRGYQQVRTSNDRRYSTNDDYIRDDRRN